MCVDMYICTCPFFSIIDPTVERKHSSHMAATDHDNTQVFDSVPSSHRSGCIEKKTKKCGPLGELPGPSIVATPGLNPIRYLQTLDTQSINLFKS